MTKPYTQQTDGIPYNLKAPFNSTFLRRYGKVFKVFDGQDSGNIAFGVADGDARYFVKFAGAPTVNAVVSAEEAIANLKRTVPIYQDLAHPNLVKLLSFEDIGGGFATVFAWTDAECMHAMYPESRRRFLLMDDETRLSVYDAILTFHAHVAARRYVAIDFYDGSIMYDFTSRHTLLCDIDFYSKTPYVNQMGRMWGSSRFMSPEEYTHGATIDEITNVYAMGAAAFALFGDERDRRMATWRMSPALFEVASKAVSDQREHRQPSIAALMNEWKAAR